MKGQTVSMRGRSELGKCTEDNRSLLCWWLICHRTRVSACLCACVRSCVCEVYWNVFALKKTHSGCWLVLSSVPRFSFSKTVITSPELPVCSSTDFLRTKWITMLWCTSPGGSRSATSHPVSPPSWTVSATPCTTTVLTPARRLLNRLLWYAHFDLWPCDQHCFASSYSFILILKICNNDWKWLSAFDKVGTCLFNGLNLLKKRVIGSI